METDNYNSSFSHFTNVSESSQTMGVNSTASFTTNNFSVDSATDQRVTANGNQTPVSTPTFSMKTNNYKSTFTHFTNEPGSNQTKSVSTTASLKSNNFSVNPASSQTASTTNVSKFTAIETATFSGTDKHKPTVVISTSAPNSTEKNSTVLFSKTDQSVILTSVFSVSPEANRTVSKATSAVTATNQSEITGFSKIPAVSTSILTSTVSTEITNSSDLIFTPRQISTASLPTGLSTAGIYIGASLGIIFLLLLGTGIFWMSLSQRFA